MDDETLMEPDEPESPVRRARVWRILGGVLLGVALLALGAIGGVVALRSGWLPLASIGATTPQGAAPVSGRADPAPATRPAVTLPGPAPAAPAASAAGDVEVVLSAEALGRAGIQTARVEAVDGRAIVQVPGSVMPNGYREVKVTPIAGGIVTRVPVELGATVRRGTPLATLSSTDLAEAQTRYLSMAAMLEADQKKLERTRKLAEIGAASRQELEEVTAVHTSRATELEAARQRLLLLGLTRDQAAALVSPTQIVSEIVVPAPIDGVVTARMANLGQVVGMGQELFVVTDLAEVWVVGDLYEQDFGSVAVGAEAVVTVPAYPGLTLRGRVTLHRPAGRSGQRAPRRSGSRCRTRTGASASGCT